MRGLLITSPAIRLQSVPARSDDCAVFHSRFRIQGAKMSSEEKIVTITRGRRKPNCASFAVIAGSTRVDISIKRAQPARHQPATVVPLVRPQGPRRAADESQS